MGKVKSTLRTSLWLSDDAVVAGRVNSSQDTETVRRSLSLSRIKAQNVCSGGVACTLNTRYENAAIRDYISLEHFPKTCVLYVFENQ